MSLEKRLKQMRRFEVTDWLESPTDAGVEDFDTIPLHEVLEELRVVAQKIREVFTREYHPDVPEPYKKWKHSGLAEEHMKSIEKRILGLLVEQEGETDDGVSKRLLRISKREK